MLNMPFFKRNAIRIHSAFKRDNQCPLALFRIRLLKFKQIFLSVQLFIKIRIFRLCDDDALGDSSEKHDTQR